MGHKPIEGSNPSLSAKLSGWFGERGLDEREGLFGVVEDQLRVEPEQPIARAI